MDVIEFIEHWKILSIAWQWLGSPTQVIALPDVGNSEKRLLQHTWKLLHRAEVVVAQNGDAFDIKKINTRMLQYRIKPTSPFKTIDTLKVAKAKFAFNSNKLDDIARDLDEGRKIKHRGFDMWRGCMEGNATDWADMKRYNKGDVDLLQRIYKRFLPWFKMPAPIYRGRTCKNCGSSHLISAGIERTMKRAYRRLRCRDCGKWAQGEVVGLRPSASASLRRDKTTRKSPRASR